MIFENEELQNRLTTILPPKLNAYKSKEEIDKLDSKR